MKNLFSGIYNNKTVLITGHTGFKGSWLSYWLKEMGAKIVGFSLSIPTEPSHFNLLDLDITSIYGDIRNLNVLEKAFEKYRPDIVFHLAAQSIVRYSYDNPIETYETNVIGTLNLFECCRKYDVQTVINITSDKAYQNNEWVWGYRETDPMGGFDPYSSSKGCSELLSASYRNSYFNIKNYGKVHTTLLATCRAGNVIGGGDWAKDRLMTDIMISTANNKKVKIRNPYATRPWQHVLEPLSGYLLLGQQLLEKKLEFATAWNFGPSVNENINVENVLQKIKKHWAKVDYSIETDFEQPHEAQLLQLDCSKARHILKWNNIWDSDTTFKKTVKWYQSYYETGKILTKEDLSAYIEEGKMMDICWTKIN